MIFLSLQVFRAPGSFLRI